MCTISLFKFLSLWLETVAWARTGRKHADDQSPEGPDSQEATTERRDGSLIKLPVLEFDINHVSPNTNHSNLRRLLFCKENFCLVYQFQNDMHREPIFESANVVTSGRVQILLKFGREVRDEE